MARGQSPPHPDVRCVAVTGFAPQNDDLGVALRRMPPYPELLYVTLNAPPPVQCLHCATTSRSPHYWCMSHGRASGMAAKPDRCAAAGTAAGCGWHRGPRAMGASRPQSRATGRPPSEGGMPPCSRCKQTCRGTVEDVTQAARGGPAQARPRTPATALRSPRALSGTVVGRPLERCHSGLLTSTTSVEGAPLGGAPGLVRNVPDTGPSPPTSAQ